MPRGRRNDRKRDNIPHHITSGFAIIFTLTLLAVVILVPSFVRQLPWFWPSFLSRNRIHLGLDLQGGSYLLLEVQLEKVKENTLQRLKDDLKSSLTDKGISFGLLERVQGNRIELKIRSGDRAKFENLLKNASTSLEIASSRSEAQTTDYILTPQERERPSIENAIVDQTLEKIRNRVDEFGLQELSIQRQGIRNVLLQVAGVNETDKVKEILGKTALLEFKLIDDTHSVEDALRTEPPPGTQILYGYGTKSGESEKQKIPYLVQEHTLMTGEDIADARLRVTELPYVLLILTSRGATILEKITRENLKRKLGIILDNRVLMEPLINEEASGGRIMLTTGDFDVVKAQELAILIRSGALPAPVRVVEERIVGPSLGADSIRRGIGSFIVGGLMVVLFMIAYYKGAGVVADVALLFHLVFMMAILAAFNAILTLPGIAGILLTVATSVDANVLINERIREELRNGKSPRGAIEMGYARALPTIIDTNATVFLAGLVLFYLGTGVIRGFAVTLCVGILTTMLSAVYLPRLYYRYRLGLPEFGGISI